MVVEILILIQIQMPYKKKKDFNLKIIPFIKKNY